MSEFINVDMVLERDRNGIISTVSFKIRPEIVSMYCGDVEDPNITLVWFDPEGNSRLIAEPVEEFEEKLRISRF